MYYYAFYYCQQFLKVMSHILENSFVTPFNSTFVK